MRFLRSVVPVVGLALLLVLLRVPVLAATVPGAPSPRASVHPTRAAGAAICRAYDSGVGFDGDNGDDGGEEGGEEREGDCDCARSESEAVADSALQQGAEEGQSRLMAAHLLLAWAVRQGAAVSHVEIVSRQRLHVDDQATANTDANVGRRRRSRRDKKTDHGLAVVARQVLNGSSKVQKKILTLPQHLLLGASAQSLREELSAMGRLQGSAIARFILEGVESGNLRGRTALAVRLVLEQRAHSKTQGGSPGQLQPTFWNAYLRHLPESVPESPLFWSAEQLAMLKGTSCLSRILADIEGLRTEFELISPWLARQQQKQQQRQRPKQPFTEAADAAVASLTIEPLSWTEFRWAWAVIFSRAFELTVSPEQPGESRMVPIADLLNHDNGAKTSFEVVGGSFVMFVGENYASGAEVFNNYSPRTTCESLRLFGYTPVENKHDAVAIDASALIDDIVNEASVRTEIMEDLELDTIAFPYSEPILRVDKKGVSASLMALFRLFSLKRRDALRRPNVMVPLHGKKEQAARAVAIQFLQERRNELERIPTLTTHAGGDPGWLLDVERVWSAERQLLEHALSSLTKVYNFDSK